MQVELAKAADTRAIAELHADGWGTTYAELASPEALGPMHGRGEIKHLYIYCSEQSRGLGSLLFNAALLY